MDIKIDNTNLSIKFLESQKYKNMEIIPIKMTDKLNKNYLTLKRGINAELVEISECEISTVNTVLVRNKAPIPLLLIDGDEIIGAKQNRIMNNSMIIPPKTNQAISVSCTEQGRWHYGTGNLESMHSTNDFKLMFEASEYVADYNTRKIKSNDLFEDLECQNDVWRSISNLEDKTSFKSNTGALNDNYEHNRTKQDEYLENFKIEYNQVGAIFVINGKIKGLELFVNPSIYFEYHEKILRSYIMDAITNYSSISGFYMNDVETFLNEITLSIFKESKNKTVSKHVKFLNKYGSGAILFDNEQIIHINYFANGDVQIKKDNPQHKHNFKNFRDFSDSF